VARDVHFRVHNRVLTVGFSPASGVDIFPGLGIDVAEPVGSDADDGAVFGVLGLEPGENGSGCGEGAVHHVAGACVPRAGVSGEGAKGHRVNGPEDERKQDEKEKLSPGCGPSPEGVGHCEGVHCWLVDASSD